MDPAPGGKPVTDSPRTWETFWGKVIACMTIALPLVAITTYVPATMQRVPPAPIVLPAADR